MRGVTVAACGTPAAIVLAALLLVPASGAAQSRVGSTPVAEADFSAVDRFWTLHDLLVRDIEPADTQWARLLATPAYRLVERNLGPIARADLEIAFRPSRRGEFERLTREMSDRGMRLTHLALAASRRRQLAALEDSLARATPIADAVALAQRYLPPGAARNGAPPLVSFAIFKDDAFSSPDLIVVDLMNAHGDELVPILAHEFHHSFVNRMSGSEGENAMDHQSLADLLYQMRSEGIADQIDKPYPFKAWSPGLEDYAARYNDEYARTPAVLRQIDSLLSALAADPARVAAVTDRTGELLWSSGHPAGAYVARTIVETFGVDSLFPGIRDPAAFLRTYAAAERARGHADPFSPGAWSVIDGIEARAWKD